MSSNYQSYSSSSYTSTSYSSSSSTNPDGITQRYTESSSTDPRGTTTHRTAEEKGKPPMSETTYIPAGGQISGGDISAQGRIEDVGDDDQVASDRAYEERIEDEYAKREGGA